jgi:hypothetical protein
MNGSKSKNEIFNASSIRETNVRGNLKMNSYKFEGIESSQDNFFKGIQSSVLNMTDELSKLLTP